MKLNNIKLLTAIFVVAGSLSIDAYANEDTLSTTELVQIENRIDRMSNRQLNTQRVQLMNEAAFLEQEQGQSQSPNKGKSISKRLSEITAELSTFCRSGFFNNKL